MIKHLLTQEKEPLLSSESEDSQSTSDKEFHGSKRWVKVSII